MRRGSESEGRAGVAGNGLHSGQRATEPRGVGRGCRHRHRARVQAAEEGGNKLQPRVEQQQHTLAPRAGLIEQRGDCPRPFVQFGVSQARRLDLAVGEESEGRAVGLLPCPPAQDFRERGYSLFRHLKTFPVT